LKEAARRGFATVVEKFIERGDDLSGTVDIALENGHESLAWCLMRAGAVPYGLKEKSAYLLLDEQLPLAGPWVRLACDVRRPDIVEQLLARGAALLPEDGPRALETVAGLGHVEIVRLLLAAGADPSATDEIDATALMWASPHGHVEVVRLLLAAGANPAHRDVGGMTVLEYARVSGSTETVARIESH
jgi:hypothetical protein